MSAVTSAVPITPQSVLPSFRKLSAENLTTQVRDRLDQAKDFRDENKTKILLVDALMSGFAMFSLKISSLLSFDSLRSKPCQVSNLKNLFGIENIPCDTSMREILDEVNPDDIRPAFNDIFSVVQRSKALENFVFMDGSYLVAMDGTGYFSSESVHCDSCLEQIHKKSETKTYYHQMLGIVLVHPDQKVVIPLCPEPIIMQDGKSKNDCERNAAKRALAKIR